MADLDELFRTSIQLEQGADEDDDVLIDVRELVTEWNASHPEPPPSEEPEPPRRSRLLAAATVLAEHIGNYPAEPVEPPTPEDAKAPEAAKAPDDGPVTPSVGFTAMFEAAVAAAASPTTRRDRRRARREIDQLQRESARKPPEGDEPTGDVKLLNAPAAPVADAEPRPPAPALEPKWADDPAPALDEPVVVPGRRERHKTWRQTEKARRSEARHQVRFPIFTRSVLVWMFIFMVAGLAFGGSAAFWWSQFNADVDEIRLETNAFADQVQGAAAALETQRQQAVDEIELLTKPLDALDPGLAPQIAEEAAPSVFLVETRDEQGAATVGSAFVIGNTEEQSLLLTSLEVVASSTIAPGPEIHVRQADKDLVAELWSWDADLDVALLLVDDPELPALEWASDAAASQALSAGVFVVGGQGGLGTTAVPGSVIDQSADGFQHTAVVGTAFRGGPILTNDGRVLGVASLGYQPLGYDTGAVHFSVPIGRTCGTVLTCAGGSPTAGTQGGPPAVEPDAAAQ